MSTAGRPYAAAEPAAARRAISMAMHIHASFSEGIASYEAHLQQARAHGVDVIWWTDHDFRVAAHRHRRAVRFDGPTEQEGELEWSWTEIREGGLSHAAAEFVPEPHSPGEPGGALRLLARGELGGGALWQHGTAFNSTYRGSLADTTLELDVLAENTGPAAVLALQIESSYHPARAGRPAGQYTLQYRIGGTDRPGRREESLRGIIELPAPIGAWHRLTLRPVEDIAQIWPDLVAEDNSLYQLRVGVIVAEGHEVSVVVDRLRFIRGRDGGASGIALRRRVLERYADLYPDVTGHEAFEVSLVRHLNWLGADLTLPELPVPPLRDNDADLTAAMIEFMHRHGALVQWNHPLDVETPESLARLMMEREDLATEVVEIGRERHLELLRVFDTAARNAIFFTGVGVSDDHEGRDWLHQRSNWITYVWAASTSLADLTGALRSGAAWFCDPVRWRGQLDILAWGTPALGRVAVTDAPFVTLRLIATELPAAGELEIIVGTVDLAGPDRPVPAYRSLRVAAADLRDGTHLLDLDPGDGSYVRQQVRDADDAVIGVGNPLWLLRCEPPRGIPPARRITP